MGMAWVWEQLKCSSCGRGQSFEFDSHLGLAVVTMSKSLFPHCSSIPSCKIGDWLQLGWRH